MSATKPPIWAVLRAHFRADVRKTGALVFLAVVMIVVYARMFFSSSGPSVADAQPAVVVGSPPVAINAAADAFAPSVVADRIPVRVSLSVSRDIQNDPFAIDPDKFPLGQGVRVEEGSAVIGQANDAVREAAKLLVLQSTLCCDPALACINGQFLRPGQEISGFVLERVEPARVVLQREGIKVVLFLK